MGVSSVNNFISYRLPFGYTYILFLATRPDGTRMLLAIFIRLLCLLHQQGRFIQKYFLSSEFQLTFCSDKNSYIIVFRPVFIKYTSFGFTIDLNYPSIVWNLQVLFFRLLR